MKRHNIDMLNGSPGKTLFAFAAPLAVVTLISFFTTALTNTLYSECAGDIIFTVQGLLNGLTTMVINTTAGIVSAAWIYTNNVRGAADEATLRKYTINSVYAVAAATVAFSVLLLAFAVPVLRLLNTPADVFGETLTYYCVYVGTYLFASVGSLFMYIINGVGSVVHIFVMNAINSCGTAAVAFLLLYVCRIGLVGAALVTAVNALILTLAGIFILRCIGGFTPAAPAEYRPDWRLVGRIIGYGLVIALQSILCSIGYLLVTVQANRYLDTRYIATVAVMIPISNMMTVLSTAVGVFSAQNYGAGKYDRIRIVFRAGLLVTVLYGVLCFLFYAFFGEWYFSRLFEDPETIRLGAERWFWYGLGFVPVAVVFIVRPFFDSVGRNRIAVWAGVFELAGNLLCAYVLIPRYGNIGCSLSFPVGWAMSAVYLLTVYAVYARKTFRPRPSSGAAARDETTKISVREEEKV